MNLLVEVIRQAVTLFLRVLVVSNPNHVRKPMSKLSLKSHVNISTLYKLLSQSGVLV